MILHHFVFMIIMINYNADFKCITMIISINYYVNVTGMGPPPKQNPNKAFTMGKIILILSIVLTLAIAVGFGLFWKTDVSGTVYIVILCRNPINFDLKCMY